MQLLKIEATTHGCVGMAHKIQNNLFRMGLDMRAKIPYEGVFFI
jgi:hypothetical protein